jgi:para-aminobenzoate synthetase component 1
MMFATHMHHQLNKLLEQPRWNKRVFVLQSHNSSNDNLIALGIENEWVCTTVNSQSLDDFQNWLDNHNDWVFGFLSYDVKNGIENLTTQHHNNTQLPDIHFVVPQVVIRYSDQHLKIEKNTSDLSNVEIQKLIADKYENVIMASLNKTLQPAMTKQEYIQAVNHLHGHIQRGDIYEINYCQEFFAYEKINHPFHTWIKLNTFTEAPFAVYMQTDEKYLMCASPERFIQRRGNKIISQPIKGTIRRGRNNEEDEQLKNELLLSEKERSENVMIVDLVRNDLSRIATKGSVKVEELFGIHTFKTVHHMISTVSAEIDDTISFTKILRALYPMGSMTGAPKVRAMQLIDEYEHSARGLYSGSLGYIEPNGDFDFNVVIRSIVCNNTIPYTSYSAGSAITALSQPEKEYDECLLKAQAMMNALK